MLDPTKAAEVGECRRSGLRAIVRDERLRVPELCEDLGQDFDCCRRGDRVHLNDLGPFRICIHDDEMKISVEGSCKISVYSGPGGGWLRPGLKLGLHRVLGELNTC